MLPNLNELAYYIIKPITLENLKKALDKAINDANSAEKNARNQKRSLPASKLLFQPNNIFIPKAKAPSQLLELRHCSGIHHTLIYWQAFHSHLLLGCYAFRSS